MNYGTTLLTRADVSGRRARVDPEIGWKPTFPDGTKLVTVISRLLRATAIPGEIDTANGETELNVSPAT